VTARTVVACGYSGDCLRVTFTPEGVRVDSTSRPGAVDATPEEWAAFVAAVKRGDFDQPAERGRR